MMERDKGKVYDYSREAVRDTLVDAFRSRRGEATVADIAALTGLPLPQINAELPAVSDEYGARLKVTESGELLYAFPEGMKSRYRGFAHGAARAWRAAKKGLALVGKAAFKVWIMATLVGYFALFIALALFALVASVAVQAGGGSRDSRSDSRGGGGLGGLWLTSRLFDSIIRIWFYSELFKDPETRWRQAEARKQRRPLNRAVFSYVFGDGDPNPDWAEIEKKAVISFLQSHRGVVTMPEFMAITGLAPLDAERAINRYLLEFEGTPEVSAQGTVYYFFPKLLAGIDAARGATEREARGAPSTLGERIILQRLEKFSSNAPKADRSFAAINLVNVVFGGYFLSQAIAVGPAFIVATSRGYALRGGISYLYSMSGYLFSSFAGIANPAAFMGWVLGAVPLAFSVLFFLIPAIRKGQVARRNRDLRFSNLRRFVYRDILRSPGAFRPEAVSVQFEEAKPDDPAAVEKVANELAAWSAADIDQGGWRFAEIERQARDAETIRAGIDPSRYAPGATVFDTQG